MMAVVERLEPPAPSFGDHYLRVICGKMVAFRLHVTQHLPPIPNKNLYKLAKLIVTFDHAGFASSAATHFLFILLKTTKHFLSCSYRQR